jgi:hypothetical protein
VPLSGCSVSAPAHASPIDLQAITQVFEPGTWVDATEFDADGHELYVLQIELGRQRDAHARMALAALPTKAQWDIA